MADPRDPPQRLDSTLTHFPVSERDTFWFHCGRCGSLFQSKTGDDDLRVCSQCGSDPSTGVMEAQVIISKVEKPVEPADTSHEGEPRKKRSVRKRRKSRFMLKLVLGWTAVLAIIVIGARLLFPEEDKQDLPPPVSEKKQEVISDEDMLLLDENLQKCGDVFAGFLQAGVPEQRNQFVLSPVTTASRMALFYSMNPLPVIQPDTLTPTANATLKLPGGKAIETLWTTQDGRRIDVVFREESGEWKIDWDHFARFSDYPWSLFLAGNEETEGEFRLLARERLAEERRNEETISLVLYAPRFGRPEESGFQSPEFLVSRRSRDGKLLDAAFELARQQKTIYQSKLPNLNPEGMIRVRVKVKRSEVNMERKFEITKVIACHWYSVDDPGVIPAPSTDADEAEDTATQSR